MALALGGTDPVPLAPSSKWLVDYQQKACVLSRQFGPAAGSIEFDFEPSMARDSGKLVLVLPEKGGNGIWQGSASIRLQPSSKTLTAPFTSALVKGKRGVVMTIFQPDMGDLVAATTIAVDLGRGAPVALQTDGMTGARKALQACQDDLVKQWGVAPADRIPDPDIPDVASWFGGDVYPPEAIRAGAQGLTLMLITIRNDGEADACRTVVSSGTEVLDQAACRVVMQKARFAKAERDPKAPLRWLILPVNWAL
jgi:TonB family protein